MPKINMPCSWRKAMKIAREYFPDIPKTKKGRDFLGYIIWNETGWPGFFQEGEKSFREQLGAASKKTIFGDPE